MRLKFLYSLFHFLSDTPWKPFFLSYELLSLHHALVTSVCATNDLGLCSFGNHQSHSSKHNVIFRNCEVVLDLHKLFQLITISRLGKSLGLFVCSALIRKFIGASSACILSISCTVSAFGIADSSMKETYSSVTLVSGLGPIMLVGSACLDK